MTQTSIRTPWLRFTGMNVRGTPRMSYEDVAEDLQMFAAMCHSGQLQEFKWDYYWGAANAILNRPVKQFRGHPGFKRGKLAPITAAQPQFYWDKFFYRDKTKVTLGNIAHGGISETRLFRAQLLTHIETNLKHWEVNGHFIVAGDQDNDEPKRKAILRNNIRRFVRLLRKLKRTGHVILGQLDANIKPGGWAYKLWIREMSKLDALFHGELGVEYLFHIDSHSDTKVQVKEVDMMFPKAHGGQLNTDHESRTLVYRLKKKIRVNK